MHYICVCVRVCLYMHFSPKSTHLHPTRAHTQIISRSRTEWYDLVRNTTLYVYIFSVILTLVV